MVQRRCGSRFLDQPSVCRLIGSYVGREQLDCYPACKLHIFRKVHLTHSTCTELGNDAGVLGAAALVL